MADLHGQTLVTELGTAQRIAAGEQGQTGAVNILPENLRLQFTAPTTGQTFTGGNIDLGNLRGTYYTAFNQSGDITFTFTNPVNGGNAFIRINSNGTGTFTFTAVESFGVTSGGTLPSGNHLFRFLQTPYGVSVVVLREIDVPVQSVNSNGLTLLNNELFLGGDVTANLGWTLVSGLWRIANSGGDVSYQISPTGGTAGVRWEVLQTANNNLGVLLLLNQTANGSAQLGYTTDGGTTFARSVDINNTRMALNGLTFPETDGSSGQALTTNGAGVLSFSTVSGGGITNGAANNEIPVSDGTNLVGSGIQTTLSTNNIFLRSLDNQLTIASGVNSSRTVRNVVVTTIANTGATNSGDVSILTGNVTGASNTSGNIIINPGLGSSGATRGNITIGPLTWPSADGTAGEFLGTDGGAVLSFSNPLDIGTPAQRITALSSATNATSIDFLSQSRFKEFSLTLSENTTVSFANGASRSSYKIFLIISGATRTITLPTGSLMPVSTSNSTDIIWTASTRELQLNVGGYELAGDYNGTNDFWKITDRYA